MSDFNYVSELEDTINVFFLEEDFFVNKSEYLLDCAYIHLENGDVEAFERLKLEAEENMTMASYYADLAEQSQCELNSIYLNGE